MVAEIEAEAKATGSYTGRETFSARTLDAMRAVPRHQFVREGDLARAYVNGPLPIGQGQTISQPFIVALMTDALDLAGGERVLEIGMGSGYQTAILAALVQHVYAVEVLAELAKAAEARLRSLGRGNVSVLVGDGHAGWPEHAPYDAILVAAAASQVPDALVAQLQPGGRMVIPVGRTRMGGQELQLLSKDASGKVSQRTVLPVAFVPLVKA
ncbi:MAG: protein-L-isoaspartate(D-aspartate) O-methyltransferase [Alphaproteobacteria bacterium]|nr:protein-L-isoaspartate(D-aspartate) O-methyltransferase [Alphaproteobacteria bacterium]